MADKQMESALSKNSEGHHGDHEKSGTSTDIKKIFGSEVTSGNDGKSKSFLSATLETLSMRGGKEKKGDTFCKSLDEAMVELKALVAQTRKHHADSCNNNSKDAWDFELTPLKDFDATEDDLLRAFALWSKKIYEKHDKEKQVFNVSKAFRRLESYIEWMDKNARDLDFQNGVTMKEIAKVWDMKMTHDKEGRLVWFCDLEALDLKYIKHKLPHDDTFRYLVWLAHLIMFDKGMQENGVVLVYSIGSIGLFESLTVVPLEMQSKFDSFTVGRLPIRVESIIFYNNPTWMRLLMTFSKPFLSKKMLSRLTLIKKEDPRKVIEGQLGRDCIPANMAQLGGTLEKDLIQDRFELLSSRSNI
ncbi:expressed unknown protein [Seminavis robusta]|uniref:CRAL-TRIO domain-containing protein n=1 Tax=Seminavis robusta TaxID=568900 RepID=A0A9N8E934_9STRA|nr:expressed unknown protein [Seminavis robusta]|eukprot:Sro684_g186810.1 n/a (358) ;mRNA; r:38655-39826